MTPTGRDDAPFVLGTDNAQIALFHIESQLLEVSRVMTLLDGIISAIAVRSSEAGTEYLATGIQGSGIYHRRPGEQDWNALADS